MTFATATLRQKSGREQTVAKTDYPWDVARITYENKAS
jgi:hypothetical protein